MANTRLGMGRASATGETTSREGSRTTRTRPRTRVPSGLRTCTATATTGRGRSARQASRRHGNNNLMRCGASSTPEVHQRDSSPSRDAGFDAVGFGQAMVDYAGYVTDEFLNEVLNDLSGEGGERYKKGDRVVCTPEQLGRVLNKIDSQNFKVTTGGSLSNTLVALSRLGGAEGKKGRGLRVGMAGLVGEDPIGSFYRAKMDRAGVEYLSQPTHKTTGTVVVLTTPDAQRTMLSHFPDDPEPEDGASPSSSSSVLTPRVVSSIVNSRVLLLEGYLLECGQRVTHSVMEAMRVARRAGTLVCLTLSDASVVNRHGDLLWRALREDGGHVDIVFANAAEASALTGESDPKRAALAIAQHTKVVSVVTDGHRGSHLAGMGASQLVPPHWMPKGPLDTCGAGDAYAAGALYGLLCGASIRGMGYTGARVSSTVISQTGARLKEEDASKLTEVLPMMMFESTRLVVPEGHRLRTKSSSS